MFDEAHIEETMRRVRKLELKARRLAREVFAGEYQSSAKGQGLDFDDLREYQHGDEVRFIDWNVTARTGQPYLRKFKQEKELSVMFAVDLSGSMDYGSVQYSKRELAAEICAILGFSALQNGDKVGLLLFAGNVEHVVPPAKGTSHLLRVIRDLLSFAPKDPSTNLEQACTDLQRLLPRRSLIFLLSDFGDFSPSSALSSLAVKHELIALEVQDPREFSLPDVGRITLLDPETRETVVWNTSSQRTRDAYAAQRREIQELWQAYFRRHQIDSASFLTTEDCLHNLHRLMKQRARQIRR